jgi:hypothetical protein
MSIRQRKCLAKYFQIHHLSSYQRRYIVERMNVVIQTLLRIHIFILFETEFLVRYLYAKRLRISEVQLQQKALLICHCTLLYSK